MPNAYSQVVGTVAVEAARPPDQSVHTGQLGAGRLIAFSVLAMPIGAAQVPLNVYLPSILTQKFGISLVVLGVIFLVEKIWGTFSDPLIGVLSDRTRSRHGRRRVWIGAGGLIFGVATLLLFLPPVRVTPIYLAIVLFAFYLGWSMIQIPYFAWSGEVSGDYDERTRIATFQTVAAAASLLLVLILPTIVDQVRPGDGSLKLAAIGGFLLVVLVPGLVLTLRAFPDHAPASTAAGRLSLLQSIRLIVGNGLLMRVLGSDFAVTLGQSIRGALFVFFVSAFMGLPRWASGLFLLQFIFGVAAGPIWLRVGYRLGKHRAAVLGEVVQVVINLGLLLVAPGRFALLLGLTIAQGLAQGSGNLMLRAMVSDIADKNRAETGEDRTGLFFSVFSISMKAAMAAAVGIALPLVAWLGFDPRVRVNSQHALHGLLLVFALGPALCHVVSALLISRFPLDATAHAEIRRRLSELDSRPASLLAE